LHIFSCFWKVFQEEYLIKLPGWSWKGITLYRVKLCTSRSSKPFGCFSCRLCLFCIILFLSLLSQLELEGSYTFDGGLSQNLSTLHWVHRLDLQRLSLCEQTSALGLCKKLIHIYSTILSSKILRVIWIFWVNVIVLLENCFQESLLITN
jgi:hypothetical protein